MQDRDVTVRIPLKASEVEASRKMCTVVETFPAAVWDYADRIEKLMLKDDPAPEDGAELAQLVAALKEECRFVGGTVTILAALVRGAVISDPEGRGRLQ